MPKWRTEWSGKFPCLCNGRWTLYRDEVELKDTNIPFQGDPADTRGMYEIWDFDDNWTEFSTFYEDGLTFEEWAVKYGDWLSSLADETDYYEIYEAFQENDFRLGSCGGCV